MAARIMFGIYLVVSGFARLLAAFSTCQYGIRLLAFISGVLSVGRALPTATLSGRHPFPERQPQQLAHTV
ncbi:hypothetical protein ACQP0C_00595 [Nocardia sp. CA-129566]|uniref:hypothetical protein n=1 Tax=Nocardia sp. CA-129566 TaxID=3239976 RepID=UPI003D98A021